MVGVTHSRRHLLKFKPDAGKSSDAHRVYGFSAPSHRVSRRIHRAQIQLSAVVRLDAVHSYLRLSQKSRMSFRRIPTCRETEKS